MATQMENTTGASELIHLRNEFYRKKYQILLGIFVLNLILFVILLTIFIQLYRGIERPIYFVANQVGSFIHEIPIQQPFPIEQVTAWTIEAVEAAASFDFVNFRSQMQDAQKYFTDYSWGLYMKGLVESNNILTLTESSRQWVWVPKVIEKPQLINSGVIAGHFAWKFRMPMLVTFLRPPLYDKASALYNAWQMEVIVIREPLLQSFNGLAVYSIIYTSTNVEQPKITTPTKPANA